MTSPAPPETNELLIVSLTPQNLERGVLWFSEHAESIKKAVRTHPWWRENAFFVEEDLVVPPLVFTRRLTDLGYERSSHVTGKGTFGVRGGVIELWPVNTKKPFIIEFHGNVIQTILERPDREERTTPKRVIEKRIDALPVGSYVVHVDHGIGIFKGTQEQNGTFFIVEYAAPAPGRAPDRLLVPTDEKDRLSPYVGFETPRIHRLGGSIWQTTKKRIKEDTLAFARSLLEIYAKRDGARRSPYEGDKVLEESIRDEFPFEETGDQLKAEETILSDLGRDTPMDRVLVGDVGFGKTEIALRAIARVIASGKQTAILAPTTVLALQHEKTFRERFTNTAINVRLLSRITPRKEEKEIIKGIERGIVDCVIGTHRLLSKDVVFKDLGLIVIDEEQRFGVRHKEHFKNLRKEIDILSLSATPIPRTLSLALAHLRDLSRLETPPSGRQPIHTFVLPYSEKLIREAIKKETERNGQIYFLHNRIETIGRACEHLEEVIRHIPNLKKKPEIGIMHGRMDARDIVRAITRFREKEITILLATTIIENGLDISSANTLIVDDATRLGLAEAHQIRGRIGRSAREAFAYFLYKPKHLTPKALERLEALEDYSELGAGYSIALRDLEIRGAGNILGKEQAGAINKVGLNLYCHMLSEAVEELRGNP